MVEAAAYSAPTSPFTAPPIGDAEGRVLAGRSDSAIAVRRAFDEVEDEPVVRDGLIPYVVNPLIRYDTRAAVLVIAFRDASTGEVRLQYPPERQVEQYRRQLLAGPSEAAPKPEAREVGSTFLDDDAAPPPADEPARRAPAAAAPAVVGPEIPLAVPLPGSGTGAPVGVSARPAPAVAAPPVAGLPVFA
jgi:hypothetical protein